MGRDFAARGASNAAGDADGGEYDYAELAVSMLWTAWTSEVHEQNAVYGESGWRVIKRTEEQPGYRIGMRAMLDNHKPNGIGKRPTRPIVGAGCYNKFELRDWGEQPNWIGNSVVETVLGIAVPVGLMSDLMILFGVEVELDETDRNYQYLSLGYRFSVWE
ncbi:MAG: hypothetical protein IPP40_09380 [bacterium]|nr:hypothetical protein [bacterium]